MDGCRQLFMVEVYRPSGEPGAAEPLARVSGDNVVASIDIPADEVTLYLVAAPDATSADRVIRGSGIRPIRVVGIRWQLDAMLEVMTSGNHPMLTSSPQRTLPTSASSVEGLEGQPQQERR
jgi:hypothetical protein